MSPSLSTALSSRWRRCLRASSTWPHYVGKPDEQVRAAFLSRAIAAYSLVQLADADPKAAGAAITDAYGDSGIDAIHFDAADKTLYLVQSKWSRPLDEADCLRYGNGVRAFVRRIFQVST